MSGTVVDWLCSVVFCLFLGCSCLYDQREEFERYGVKRRDPMFMTAMTLLELEAFPSVDSLARYCSTLDVDMVDELKSIQWLFDGMTDEDLQNATEPQARRHVSASTQLSSLDASSFCRCLPHCTLPQARMFKDWPGVCALRNARIANSEFDTPLPKL
jgi:hypothetical protein